MGASVVRACFFSARDTRRGEEDDHEPDGLGDLAGHLVFGRAVPVGGSVDGDCEHCDDEDDPGHAPSIGAWAVSRWRVHSRSNRRRGLRLA